MLKSDLTLLSLDVETTGTSPDVDRIVQIGIVKRLPTGEQSEWQSLVDPEVPIPEESTKVHGITDEDVDGAPTFKSLAPGLANGLHNVHFCGFNLSFDIQCLIAEFTRAGIAHPLHNVKIAEAWRLYQRAHPRDLAAFVEEYFPKDRMPEEYAQFKDRAHDALVDARSTLICIDSFLERHTDMPQTVNELHDLVFETAQPGYVDPDRKFKWVNGEAVCSFGKKHNGNALRAIAEKDPGFLEWMVRSNFPPKTKEIASNALKGVFPQL